MRRQWSPKSTVSRTRRSERGTSSTSTIVPTRTSMASTTAGEIAGLRDAGVMTAPAFDLVTFPGLARTVGDDGLPRPVFAVRARRPSIRSVSFGRPGAGGRYHVRNVPAGVELHGAHSRGNGEVVPFCYCTQCAP